MSWRPHWGRQDHSVTLDAANDDWRWRARVRSNRRSHLIYQVLVGIGGLVIVVVGLIMVPFPGPGWLVVFIGLGVWASEFEWAKRLLHRARAVLEAWTHWLGPQSWWVQALVLLLTIAAVVAIFWLLLLISAVPSYLPDLVQQWLKKAPGVQR
jgi:uncharacterized protein (TIGR02611 family)